MKALAECKDGGGDQAIEIVVSSSYELKPVCSARISVSMTLRPLADSSRVLVFLETVNKVRDAALFFN